MPLWKTYWVFGFLVSLFFVLTFTYIDKNSLHFFALPGAASLTWAVRATGLGYGVLLWVAIWRSAGKYDGPGVYSGLARASVVLGIITSLGQLIGSLTQLSFPDVITEQSLQDDAATVNRQLPELLGNGIRLDRLTADGMTIIYDYTMLNESSSNADVATLRRRIDSIRTDTCLQMEKRLALGLVIKYRYSGSDGGYILSFDVDRESCRQPNY